VTGTPAGLGEPVFDKLHAELGKAMLSINAVKGFEYGSGFAGVEKYGSEHNDRFYTDETGRIRTRTNFSGGIQGGISNGEDIFFRVAFKPVATIMQGQESINEKGEVITVEGKGRHDPCVGSPRRAHRGSHDGAGAGRLLPAQQGCQDGVRELRNERVYSQTP
jgi:chorismate synthase